METTPKIHEVERNGPGVGGMNLYATLLQEADGNSVKDSVKIQLTALLTIFSEEATKGSSHNFKSG